MKSVIVGILVMAATLLDSSSRDGLFARVVKPNVGPSSINVESASGVPTLQGGCVDSGWVATFEISETVRSGACASNPCAAAKQRYLEDRAKCSRGVRKDKGGEPKLPDGDSSACARCKADAQYLDSQCSGYGGGHTGTCEDCRNIPKDKDCHDWRRKPEPGETMPGQCSGGHPISIPQSGCVSQCDNGNKSVCCYYPRESDGTCEDLTGKTPSDCGVNWSGDVVCRKPRADLVCQPCPIFGP